MRLNCSAIVKKPQKGSFFGVLFYYHGNNGHFDVFLFNHYRIK